MCTDSQIHLDWQWNVNPWSKQDNPSSALGLFLCGALSGGYPHSSDHAFRWLLYGQRHNAAATASYERCVTNGELHLYAAVAGAAGDRVPDFEDVLIHLEWQAYADPLSIDRALAVRDVEGSDSPAVLREIAALYNLLQGASISPNVCQLYRACWRADPERLFAAAQLMLDGIKSGRMLHPYLLGAEPAPTSLANVVPR